MEGEKETSTDKLRKAATEIRERHEEVNGLRHMLMSGKERPANQKQYRKRWFAAMEVLRARRPDLEKEINEQIQQRRLFWCKEERLVELMEENTALKAEILMLKEVLKSAGQNSGYASGHKPGHDC